MAEVEAREEEAAMREEEEEEEERRLRLKAEGWAQGHYSDFSDDRGGGGGGGGVRSRRASGDWDREGGLKRRR